MAMEAAPTSQLAGQWPNSLLPQVSCAFMQEDRPMEPYQTSAGCGGFGRICIVSELGRNLESLLVRLLSGELILPSLDEVKPVKLLNLEAHSVLSPDVKFSVTPSSNGGIDINIGSDTIHVPKYLSAQHPLVQMLLFAELTSDQFRYPKSLAPKGIVKMSEKSRSSDSRNVYEAGWTSARPQSQPPNLPAALLATVLTGERFGRSSKPLLPLPVLFDVSTKKETSNPVSAAPGAGGDGGFILDSGASSRPVFANCSNVKIENIATSSGSMDCGADPGSTMQEQLLVHRLGDEHRDSLHFSGASGISSSPERTSISVEHELNETELEYGREPDSAVAAQRVSANTEEANKAPATWIVSTAAPHHATGNRGLLTGFVAWDDAFSVHAADGAPMQVLGCGTVVTDSVVLPDVWYVPGLTANLVSVGQLAELDYSVGFCRSSCFVRDPGAGNDAVVGEASIGDGGLFEVNFLKVQLRSM